MRLIRFGYGKKEMGLVLMRRKKNKKEEEKRRGGEEGMGINTIL